MQQKMCSNQSASLLIKRIVVSPIQTFCRSFNYVHPVTGKKPPTLEEFDPLNPGEWQLGASGKILPRLPEGTRCGNLVMGKYGLYTPWVRKFQEECLPKFEAGIPAELITKNEVFTFKLMAAAAVISVIVGVHNCLMMTFGTKEKPLWPYTLWMKKAEE